MHSDDNPSNPLLDVIRCRSTRWITSHSVRSFDSLSLIDSDIINIHLAREDEMLVILLLEPWGHAQVQNQVLRYG